MENANQKENQFSSADRKFGTKKQTGEEKICRDLEALKSSNEIAHGA